MVKSFSKKVEDFTCGNCGRKVSGNGYTNHCPYCLYSLHVDVNPGDRKNSCNGLMKPKRVEYSSGEFIIYHECVVCGMVKKNKASNDDNKELLFKIMKKQE